MVGSLHTLRFEQNGVILSTVFCVSYRIQAPFKPGKLLLQASIQFAPIVYNLLQSFAPA